jgi:hypothetical protein
MIVLALLVMRLRTDVQHLHGVLAQVVEQLAVGSPHSPQPVQTWPEETGLQPGGPAPAPLTAADTWKLALIAYTVQELTRILPDDPERAALAARYELVAVVPEDVKDDRGAVPLPLARIDPQTMATLPAPAVALIDPDAIVQGVATAENVDDVMAFVFEGEHRGFGPARQAQEVPAP